MTDELKPCPFCGGEPLAMETHPGYGLVCCSRCGASTDPDEAMPPDELVKAWNTRYKRTCEIGDGLDCSNCGAIFDIGPCDKPRFCMYCGAEVADADAA